MVKTHFIRFIVLICLSFIHTGIQAQQTVNFTELKFIEGKYYKIGSDNPFTGISERYFVSGESESITTIEKGIETGEFKIFFDSGAKRVHVSKKLGAKNTFNLLVWNEDGSIAFKGKKENKIRFKNGDINPFTGAISILYKNGDIAEQASFKDGMWHGKQTRYSRKGKVEFECTFINNQIVECEDINAQE